MKTQFHTLKFSVAKAGMDLTSERAGGLLRATQPEREELDLNPGWPASEMSAFLLGCSSATFRAYYCSSIHLGLSGLALLLLLPPDELPTSNPRDTVPTAELRLACPGPISTLSSSSRRPRLWLCTRSERVLVSTGDPFEFVCRTLCQGIQSPLTAARV